MLECVPWFRMFCLMLALGGCLSFVTKAQQDGDSWQTIVPQPDYHSDSGAFLNTIAYSVRAAARQELFDHVYEDARMVQAQIFLAIDNFNSSQLNALFERYIGMSPEEASRDPDTSTYLILYALRKIETDALRKIETTSVATALIKVFLRKLSWHPFATDAAFYLWLIHADASTNTSVPSVDNIQEYLTSIGIINLTLDNDRINTYLALLKYSIQHANNASNNDALAALPPGYSAMITAYDTKTGTISTLQIALLGYIINESPNFSLEPLGEINDPLLNASTIHQAFLTYYLMPDFKITQIMLSAHYLRSQNSQSRKQAFLALPFMHADQDQQVCDATITFRACFIRARVLAKSHATDRAWKFLPHVVNARSMEDYLYLHKEKVLSLPKGHRTWFNVLDSDMVDEDRHDRFYAFLFFVNLWASEKSRSLDSYIEFKNFLLEHAEYSFPSRHFKTDQQEYVYSNLGNIYYAIYGVTKKIQDIKNAVHYWQKSIEISSSSAILNSLAYTISEHGTDMNLALGYINAALEEHPEAAHYLDTKGWIYYKLGRYADAIAYLTKAIERNPDDGEVYSHLAAAFWKHGDIHSASMHMKQIEQRYKKYSVTPKELALPILRQMLHAG